MNQNTQVNQYISRSFPWKLICCQMKKRSPLKRKSEWKLIGMDFIKLHWFGSQDVYGWLPARLLLYWPRVYWFDSLTNLSQRLSIGQNYQAVGEINGCFMEKRNDRIVLINKLAEKQSTNKCQTCNWYRLHGRKQKKSVFNVYRFRVCWLKNVCFTGFEIASCFSFKKK